LSPDKPSGVFLANARASSKVTLQLGQSMPIFSQVKPVGGARIVEARASV
jgi:hypothetical protein